MLQLEHLSTASPECPFLRISGEDPRAATVLRDAFFDLSQGMTDRVTLSELPSITALNECRLIAAVGKRNRGIVQRSDGKTFDWVLTPAGWDNNVGLIGGFCECCAGHNYQWLDSPSDIAVLFSPSGQW
jgi:hypothetical protein